jgi:hypothetical protein
MTTLREARSLSGPPRNPGRQTEGWWRGMWERVRLAVPVFALIAAMFAAGSKTPPPRTGGSAGANATATLVHPYYSDLDSSLTGTALRHALQALISHPHRIQSYTPGVWRCCARLCVVSARIVRQLRPLCLSLAVRRSSVATCRYSSRHCVAHRPPHTAGLSRCWTGTPSGSACTTGTPPR